MKVFVCFAFFLCYSVNGEYQRLPHELQYTMNADFNCIGNCTPSTTGPDCFRLTENTQQQSGVIWSAHSFQMTSPLVVETKMNFGRRKSGFLTDMDYGSDGITFVLQSVRSDVHSSNLGDGLGFSGSTPSLAVELGTFYNRNISDAEDHFALIRDGNLMKDILNDTYSLGHDLTDGTFHNVTFRWVGVTSTISVFINGMQVLLSSNIDITGILNSDSAFLGFIAATDGSSNTHEVCIHSINGSQVKKIHVPPSRRFLSDVSMGVPSSVTGDRQLENSFNCLENCTVSFTEEHCFQLTNKMKKQNGVVWSNEPLQVDQSFVVEVDMYFGVNDSRLGFSGDPGAGGIAFVLQNGGSNVIGSQRGGLEYSNISSSLVVELDTYRRNGTKDAAEVHVALVRDGTQMTGVLSGPEPLSFNLEHGAFHHAIFEWMSEASTMTVTINGTLVLTAPYLNMTGILGSNYAYMGFTASTGTSTNVRKVCTRSIRGTTFEVPSLSPSSNPTLSPAISPSFDHIAIPALVLSVNVSLLHTVPSSAHPSDAPSTTLSPGFAVSHSDVSSINPSDLPALTELDSPSGRTSASPSDVSLPYRGEKLSLLRSVPPSSRLSTTLSVAPSFSPSKESSRSPSNTPLIRSNTTPSSEPSMVHSNNPSFRISNASTYDLSRRASYSPSATSSTFPINVPVTSSTRIPTRSPTPVPTRDRSKEPTKFPTQPPTKAPTKSPMNGLSVSPSITSTDFPTRSFTEFPSKPPTKSPFVGTTPTQKPSREIETSTKLPTKVPTKTPSKAPTKAPSNAPTKAPHRTSRKALTKSPTTKIPTKAPATKTRTKWPTKSSTKIPSKSSIKTLTKAPVRTSTNAVSHDKKGGKDRDVDKDDSTTLNGGESGKKGNGKLRRMRSNKN